MGAPKKSGGRHCYQCSAVPAQEVFRLTHNRIGKPDDSELIFCSQACVLEHFETLYLDKVEDKVKKEMAFLHRRVCPACKRRLAELE